MALINDTDLRDRFNVAGLSEGQISFAITDAARMLKTWVGADAYEDAGAVDPEDEDAAEALAAAEGYLAMFHALLNTGTRLRTNGVVAREQDATGALGGNVINQYYTPAELIALRNEYFTAAQTIAAPYLAAEEQTATLRTGTMTMQGGWRKCETLLES